MKEERGEAYVTHTYEGREIARASSCEISMMRIPFRL